MMSIDFRANLMLLSTFLISATIPLALLNSETSVNIPGLGCAWVIQGAYMTYEQRFEWSNQTETDYMAWNVTSVQGHLIGLYLLSHGVNVTDGNVTRTTGEADITIDATSRVVTNCSDPSYVGEKWPFWIETNMTLGSPVDNWYGTSVISGDESILVLGQHIDCWIVEYTWATATMKRWYDKSSGIVLKIRVTLSRQDVTLTTTETAVRTSVQTYCRVLNLNTGLSYPTIQGALDANQTLDAHTLRADSGVYFERVVVNKSVCILGENKHDTVLDGSGIEHVIHVMKDNSTIRGFTIRQSNLSREQDLYAGIRLDEVAHCNVSGNILTNTCVGVMLAYSRQCVIFENLMLDNWCGIALTWDCDFNLIAGNNISGCGEWASIYVDMSENNVVANNLLANSSGRGIFLRRANFNSLMENTVIQHSGSINPGAIAVEEQSHDNSILRNQVVLNDFGIRLEESYDNIISENIVRENYCGLLVYQSRSNTISGNQLSNNYGAIEITHASSDNVISQNNITGNSYGVGFWYSNNNTVSGNAISASSVFGVLVSYSRDNRIYHNNFTDNKVQLSASSGYSNSLDDGFPSGGNFWSDYQARYPNATELDGSGLWDTPYVINEDNQDNYPIIPEFPTPWLSLFALATSLVTLVCKKKSNT